jgi:hypothetical protein
MELGIKLHLTDSPNVGKPKMLWSRASAQCVQEYRSSLERVLECGSPHVFQYEQVGCNLVLHKNELKKYSTLLWPQCLDSSHNIPLRLRASCRRIPGWTILVKPHLDKALFWHALWIDNGCPESGVVADIRRHTRSMYHKAVKKAKNSETGLRYRGMAENFKGGTRTDFWSNASNIEGISGDKDIANCFADNYSALYQSVPTSMEKILSIKAEISQRMEVHTESMCTAHTITASDVEVAIKKLKPNKRDGDKGLYMDHLKKSSPSLKIHLAILFNGMLMHGFTPMEFGHSVLVPIPKNLRHSLNDAGNYRSIALNSVLNKLFDKIVLSKCKLQLSTSNHQFGFKAGHSTQHCSFVLNEIVNHYRSEGSNVYLCLLDASKAFDRLEYEHLFNLLLKRNMCPSVLNLLLHMYISQTACVQWKNKKSDLFAVQNGVKQGGVLSPTLFNIYLDELLSRLKENGAGCHIGRTWCGSLSYADDVVLLSPSLCGIKEMLNICKEYAMEYKMLFNASKSKLIVLSDDQLQAIPPIHFMGGVIAQVQVDKHLGILIGNIDEKAKIDTLCREMAKQCVML